MPLRALRNIQHQDDLAMREWAYLGSPTAQYQEGSLVSDLCEGQAAVMEQAAPSLTTRRVDNYLML